ncbi:P-loop containing nucleoside triphosphate hydrolase protein [Marasmius fiardii PR-910]|nr:P-loop containing nucleoside triphosphate hydrolase protein [Marasmius fiardii PR-910]
MKRGRRRHGAIGKGKGAFNPEDEKRVKHTQIGVWDLYEEKQPERLPGTSRLKLDAYIEHFLEVYNCLPYVWRMLKDIGSIRECWFLLGVYLSLETLSSLTPALSLWYSSQLLTIVQNAIEHRTVDKDLLFHIALGRVLCSSVTIFFDWGKTRLARYLNLLIKQYYSGHMFQTMARLDVPTFEDSGIQRQLEQVFTPDSRTSIAWEVVTVAVRLFTTVLQLASQLSVLVTVLKHQRDGPLLAVLSFSQTLFTWGTQSPYMPLVWAATTKNEDYIKMEGLKRTIGSMSHRKEIVAGGMWGYMHSEFLRCSNALGSKASAFFPMYNLVMVGDRFPFSRVLRVPLKELPQIVFTLRAVQYPSSIPLSLASLNLITQTTTSFSNLLVSLFGQTTSVVESLSSVRRLYTVMALPNQIQDGATPFPEDQQALRIGISVEFRQVLNHNVSFRYPESENYALHRTSFRIEKGQLCVIVGKNGSGKSTILKLIARLYDPEEGEILIDGHDIKTLKLADLRRATTVLFQDYTHFPLSIKDNIGYGDPQRATDEERIEQAARLGGADEFIRKLADKYDTYLERPVQDMYSNLPEGTKTVFGRNIDFRGLRMAGHMRSTDSSGLSGGQMQRIALSRTFMRTLDEEQQVGLLLFDEPSASLDPTAEHDLFERLRRLRGQKTMIFSTHRFSNLTRHADLILYMDDSVVVEEGTHESLVRKNGEYARLWNLQAQAFFS